MRSRVSGFNRLRNPWRYESAQPPLGILRSGIIGSLRLEDQATLRTGRAGRRRYAFGAPRHLGSEDTLDQAAT